MIKQRGKVYPSLSSSSYKDTQSVLKLLPVAIFALASALPSHDQEVLAYMLTRSIITTTTNPSSLAHQSKNKCKKTQKVPLFQCGCFDCYTSFWFRWDSSPNRELIHQAIEAFEEHLTSNEFPKKHNRGKNRGKLLMGRSESDISGNVSEEVLVPAMADISLLESKIAAMPVIECGEEEIENMGKCVVVEEEEKEERNVSEEVTGNLEMQVVAVRVPVSNHKGLARKVLPDVLGLFNSRLWSLWSPSI